MNVATEAPLASPAARPLLLLPLRDRAAFRQQSFDQDDEGGLFIAGDIDVAVGETVEVDIQFVAEQVRFRVRTLVRWKRAAGRRMAPPGVGLTFLPSEQSTREQLLRFVDGEDVRQLERDTLRLPIVAEARLDIPATDDSPGRQLTCQTDDISAGGCFLVVDPAPPIGTVVKVRLKGPGLLFSWLSLDAVVCWARSGGAANGVGVRFILDGERQRRRLDKLLAVLRDRVTRDVRLLATRPGTSTPPSQASTSMLPRK